MRAGHRLAIGHSLDGQLRAVRYQIDLERTLHVAPAVIPVVPSLPPTDFTAAIETVPAKTQLTSIIGKVEGSLFESVIDSGEEPELAILLADIFGWDLDFHSDPRRGDTFRVAVEKNGEITLAEPMKRRLAIGRQRHAFGSRQFEPDRVAAADL